MNKESEAVKYVYIIIHFVYWNSAFEGRDGIGGGAEGSPDRRFQYRKELV